MHIIDFSAHDTWAKCPAMWFEKYVNKRRKRWPKAQRDDALCLGSLVHEGLKVWQETHTINIPPGVQDEMTPSRECLDLALELVYGYARAFPEELWPLIVCEEPVVFQLEGTVDYGRPPYLQGLAKIDSYFYVPEYTTIETGFGMQQVLTPGWWIHEYKTKSPYVPVGLYMQGWEMGLQASYQMMALQHHLDKGPSDLRIQALIPPQGQYEGNVQGVLVNVLEKPKRHVPKRKCRKCDELYEFATWVPTGRGEYACPVCGSTQALQPLKSEIPQIAPAYYRIAVQRTPQELARDKASIITVGKRMQAMEVGGLYSEPWNNASCVNFQWKRSCDYFGSHKNFSSTMEDAEYETVPDYRGLVQLEGGSE